MCIIKWMFLVVFSLLVWPCNTSRYLPTWDSLDKRPLPSWYDEGKIGIFLHWGVFSVPSYKSEWFWYYWKATMAGDVVKFMKENYRPGFTYADFAQMFRAEFYNPFTWADIFNSSGAKYVVLTSKHHEGFCNWPTKVSWNWNSMDTGPNRDLVGELVQAIRNRTKLHFGIYHSLFEWFHPIYNQDHENDFRTQDFVRQKAGPELYELVLNYKPDVIWSDGAAGPSHYWNSTHFLAWLYNDSPVRETVVTNDRWGTDTPCLHGGYYTCQDRYNPGHLLNHKWENAMTLDRFSWGYRRDAGVGDYLRIEELLETLVTTVSCGGNLLVNVGPTHDGMIPPIMEERLRQMGQWLNVNGESIYKSKPWTHQNDTTTKNIWYTQSQDGSSVYAFLLNWPEGGKLLLGAPVTTSQTTVKLVGYSAAVAWQPHEKSGITVTLPGDARGALHWVWVLHLHAVKSTATGHRPPMLPVVPRPLRDMGVNNQHPDRL